MVDLDKPAAPTKAGANPTAGIVVATTVAPATPPEGGVMVTINGVTMRAQLPADAGPPERPTPRRILSAEQYAEERAREARVRAGAAVEFPGLIPGSTLTLTPPTEDSPNGGVAVYNPEIRSSVDLSARDLKRLASAVFRRPRTAAK